jgi:hypothetical protein
MHRLLESSKIGNVNSLEKMNPNLAIANELTIARIIINHRSAFNVLQWISQTFGSVKFTKRYKDVSKTNL